MYGCNVDSNKYEYFWIGLYKSRAAASNNVTYWLDGNPSTYRNWYLGGPKSVDPCVTIYDGKFHDGPCTSVLRYICKGVYCLSNAMHIIAALNRI